MPTRREFRGAADGLLGAFVSRNNDVGGYWALGRLYEHARLSKEHEIRVDLIRSAIAPPSTEFNDMVEHFRQWLVDQLSRRKLPNEWLSDAEIRLGFSGKKSTDNPGDVFECVVTLTDDLGHVHQARGSGTCWFHDPVKELKSARIRSFGSKN